MPSSSSAASNRLKAAVRKRNQAARDDNASVRLYNQAVRCATRQFKIRQLGGAR